VHARVNTIFGPPDKVAAGVARVEGTDRAAVEAARGNRGLMTLMDSAGGVIVAVSYWDDLIHSSAPGLTEVRERVAAAAEGDLVAERYAVGWQEPGPTPAWPGATVRIDRLQIDPTTAVTGQDLLYTHVLQETRTDQGFCGAEFMIDRSHGVALLLTTWTSAAAATRMDAVVAQLRDLGTRAGITLRRTEAFVLVRGCAPI
jgi:hypothetical protein